jgi:hypothetical protein
MDATVLHRELVAARFDRSYPTLVRELRRLELRPVCLVCQHRRGRAVTVDINGDSYRMRAHQHAIGSLRPAITGGEILVITREEIA